jgi:hypothetical protein
MARIKKPFEKPPQSPPNGPAQAAAQWWRPTSGWGILGLIIFAGLVLRTIDLVGGLLAAQLDKPSIDRAAATPIRPASSFPSK